MDCLRWSLSRRLPYSMMRRTNILLFLLSLGFTGNLILFKDFDTISCFWWFVGLPVLSFMHQIFALVGARTSHSMNHHKLVSSKLNQLLMEPEGVLTSDRTLHTPFHREQVTAMLECIFQHQPSGQCCREMRVQLLVRRPATGILCTCMAEERCNGSKKSHRDGYRTHWWE